LCAIEQKKLIPEKYGMRRIILILFIINAFGTIQAQNTFKAFLKDEETKEPLIFANIIVEDTENGASSDTTGFVELKNISDGKQTIIFSYVGYRTKEKTFIFPLNQKTPFIIYLEKAVDLDEVEVYSTRTNNRIKEIPTRIEVLGNEEVVEETAINPGNISKLLGETSGIQVQHTSAISGNVSFRIQGLPGKYTQLLQDGFPVYSGFSSGLSLLQIPPLDLQQVEIVKGSASTLYGADAIAGIVNLITKKPSEKPEFSVLLNQTHKGGTDFSSFYTAKKDKFGVTMLASINTQKAMDVSGNSFTDIPKYDRAVFSPKIFYDFNKNNHLYLGLSSVIEDRIGGDIKAINDEIDSLHLFYEENKTKRFNTNLKYENINQSGNVFTFKASYGNFDRKMKTNTNIFSGVQNNIFGELSYFINSEKHKLVSGINFYSDDFSQSNPDIFSLNYSYQTIGVFTQDNWKLSKKIFLEPGIRYDYNIQNGGFFLPRLALMYKFSKKFFTRLSGGMGYKLPTPFTDEAERTRYQMVIMPTNLKVEKSTGANLDFNYKTSIFDELFLSFNQAFFITNITNPIIANIDSLQNQVVSYENAQGTILSKGLNTNIRLSLDELVLYIDYTYLDAQKTYDNNKQLELTPQNRLTTTLAYEDEEEGWKAGLEAFYFGNQYLENGSKTTDYWLLGASVQKRIGHFTIALNVENILDVQQTRYENIVSGSINNPTFSELYAPLDGIVGNMVLKFDLF
jgi:iron complex outermembrane receptor protein